MGSLPQWRDVYVWTGPSALAVQRRRWLGLTPLPLRLGGGVPEERQRR